MSSTTDSEIFAGRTDVKDSNGPSTSAFPDGDVTASDTLSDGSAAGGSDQQSADQPPRFEELYPNVFYIPTAFKPEYLKDSFLKAETERAKNAEELRIDGRWGTDKLKHSGLTSQQDLQQMSWFISTWNRFVPFDDPETALQAPRYSIPTNLKRVKVVTPQYTWAETLTHSRVLENQFVRGERDPGELITEAMARSGQEFPTTEREYGPGRLDGLENEGTMRDPTMYYTLFEVLSKLRGVEAYVDVTPVNEAALSHCSLQRSDLGAMLRLFCQDNCIDFSKFPPRALDGVKSLTESWARSLVWHPQMTLTVIAPEGQEGWWGARVQSEFKTAALVGQYLFEVTQQRSLSQRIYRTLFGNFTLYWATRRVLRRFKVVSKAEYEASKARGL